MFLMEYLSPNKFPTIKDVEEAQYFYSRHGEPFNMDGFIELLALGYWPIRIQAVEEGSVIPTGNVLVQIMNTHKNFYWLPSFLETMLLRAVWYPTTVCTLSWMCRNLIYDFLIKTSDEPDAQIDFKLHDFGARGTSSFETASIGGCAHLVNFKGTDTISGVLAAHTYYNEPMAGFSIPAAEHSTVTSWGGPEVEVLAYKNMLDKFLSPGRTVAVVSDSYDIFYAIRELWGKQLKQQIINSGATLVIRPDSGNPVTIVRDVIKELMNSFNFYTNSKGYDILPPYIRIIQGDGVEYDSIKDILTEITNCRISTDNVSFGMGGALLQNLNRDFLKFAMKTSAIKTEGRDWQDVYKEPVTDRGKASKRGRLALYKTAHNQYRTIREIEIDFGRENLLLDVYLNGEILEKWEFKDIRARAQNPI
jgi:nicotinamide phosphoribosyltransferase